MAKKIPIKDGEGNCCPLCGGTKISIIYQCPLMVEVDLSTGKEIFTVKGGVRTYKPSQRDLAALHKKSQVDAQFRQFQCRNEECGWISAPIVP